MSSISGAGSGGSGSMGIQTITGNTGGALSGTNINIVGGTTGLVFNGAGTTETLGGTLVVANGGTGIATATAYAPIIAGTTATGPFQVASTGQSTSGFVLTSTGASSVPTWQAVASGVTIAGDSGTSTSSSFTFLAKGAFTNRVGVTWLFTNDGSGGIKLTSQDASSNIAMGQQSFMNDSYVQIPGSQNTAIGSSVLAGIASPGTFSTNSAFGALAGAMFSANGSSLSSNSYFGVSAGRCLGAASSSTIADNSFFGASAGLNSNASTGFSNNCAFGSGAMGTAALTTASNNSAFGYGSLQSIQSGTGNIAAGSFSGSNYASSESSNIIIGHGDIAAESNQTKIGYVNGSPTQTGCFIDGIDGVTVTGTAVLVASGGQLGIAVSSAKYKDNIKDMGDLSSRALNLRPVTFSYKGGNEVRFGLIAEEVHEVLPELVVYDKAGDAQTVMYHELPAILLNELQKALKRIEVLESKLGA